MYGTIRVASSAAFYAKSALWICIDAVCTYVLFWVSCTLFGNANANVRGARADLYSNGDYWWRRAASERTWLYFSLARWMWLLVLKHRSVHYPPHFATSNTRLHVPRVCTVLWRSFLTPRVHYAQGCLIYRLFRHPVDIFTNNAVRSWTALSLIIVRSVYVSRSWNQACYQTISTNMA